MKPVVLISLSLCLSVFAQEASHKHMRFIPLGDLPPHRETIKNGVRIQFPPAPGTVPPKPTTLAIDPKEGRDVPLRLKEFTEWSSINPTAGGVRIFQGKQIGGKAWISSSFSSKSQSLGVLYADHQNKNWFNPKMMLVPDDLSTFPPGSIRFVNVSHCSALVRFGNEKADVIAPGKVLLKKLKQGNHPVLVGYLAPSKNNAREVIFQNELMMKPKQRIQAFFYQARGKNPRKAVKFFHRGEFYVPPPKLKKDAAVAGG
ncbi:hypothetical protein GYB43_01480 [bacterium]|jgi:hypothetical protein|nr:hypothetical protein [bacterium]